LAKKHILTPIVRPKSASDDENLDMMRYRVEYLREKREKGDLPPLPAHTLLDRSREYWSNLKTEASSTLGIFLFVALCILALPFAPFIIAKEELYDRQIRGKRKTREWAHDLKTRRFPDTLWTCRAFVPPQVLV